MATASSDLAALLDDPGRRAAAAMALGRRGAREYADRIAAALPNLEGRDRTAFAVALEQLGDPAVVPALRPAALLWGWVEQKYVEMEHLERFLVGVTLDGHHRHAAAGVPARAVLFARLEDCWGEDPELFLTEAVTPLLAPH